MFELIYTFASQGIKPGSSKFCSVAWTEGMPKGYIAPLEKISFYVESFKSGTPEAENNPVAFSYQLCPLGQEKVIPVISRTASLGLHQTGNKNFIAHHIVLETENEIDFKCPSAVFLQKDNFYTKWSGESRRLEKRELKFAASPPETGNAGAWEQYTGSATWSSTIAKNFTNGKKEPVYVEYEAAKDISTDILLKLVDEIYILLPEGQRRFFTYNTYTAIQPLEHAYFLRCCAANSKLLLDAKRDQKVLPIKLSSKAKSHANLEDSIFKGHVHSKSREEDSMFSPTGEKQPWKNPSTKQPLQQEIQASSVYSPPGSSSSGAQKYSRNPEQSAAKWEINKTNIQILIIVILLIIVIGFSLYLVYIMTARKSRMGKSKLHVSVKNEQLDFRKKTDDKKKNNKLLQHTAPAKVPRSDAGAGNQPKGKSDHHPEIKTTDNRKELPVPEAGQEAVKPVAGVGQGTAKSEKAQNPPSEIKQPNPQPPKELNFNDRFEFYTKMKKLADKTGKFSVELPTVKSNSQIRIEADRIAGKTNINKMINEIIYFDNSAAGMYAVNEKKSDYGTIQRQPDRTIKLQVEPSDGALLFSVPEKQVLDAKTLIPTLSDISGVIVDGKRISTRWVSGYLSKIAPGKWKWDSQLDEFTYLPSREEKEFNITIKNDLRIKVKAFKRELQKVNRSRKISRKTEEIKQLKQKIPEWEKQWQDLFNQLARAKQEIEKLPEEARKGQSIHTKLANYTKFPRNSLNGKAGNWNKLIRKLGNFRKKIIVDLDSVGINASHTALYKMKYNKNNLQDIKELLDSRLRKIKIFHEQYPDYIDKLLKNYSSILIPDGRKELSIALKTQSQKNINLQPFAEYLVVKDFRLRQKSNKE